ncbi:hypothetical protein [Streptococcus mitis]|uniref:Uncharacterized protein n=1 Tax=Streptococcus mitis TaxID=28037 RepID=A0A428D260_STRMT|nr:hypothetical protein [Streptococcus mitis]RSI86210.1 hypothetical protein D8849_06915 [Streptococcus mitis]
MDFQIYLIVLLIILVIYLLRKKFIIKNKFTQYIIDNGEKEVASIKNNEDSFYNSAKLLNKRYKIGLLNAYTIVNLIEEKENKPE